MPHFPEMKRAIKKLLVIYFKECFSFVSSKSFIVSGLTFMSLIHFDFSFVYGIRECPSFILLHVAIHFSQHHLLKPCLFSILYSCLLCHRLGDHRCVSSSLGSLYCSIDPYFCFLCQYHIILITVALH